MKPAATTKGISCERIIRKKRSLYGTAKQAATERAAFEILTDDDAPRVPILA